MNYNKKFKVYAFLYSLNDLPNLFVLFLITFNANSFTHNKLINSTKEIINEITYETASNKISYLIHSTYKMQVIINKQFNKDLLISFGFADT